MKQEYKPKVIINFLQAIISRGILKRYSLL